MTEERRSRLELIDALRGLACLWVVALHYLAFVDGNAVAPHGLARAVTTGAALGYLGVDMFLVLSGFCLFYPVARKQAPRTWRVPLGPFLQRRARRILPPYYVSLILYVALALLPTETCLVRSISSSPFDLPLHLLLLHNLLPVTAGSINIVYWSLALEWQLYLLFPLLLMLARHGGMRAVLGATLAISLLWRAGTSVLLGKECTEALGFSIWNALPALAFTFACGMMAARQLARPTAGQTRLAALICAVAGALGLMLSLPAAGRLPVSAAFAPAQHYCWGVCFAALVIALGSAITRFPRLERLLIPLRNVGVISYSVYLIHMAEIGVFRAMARALAWNSSQSLAIFLLGGLPILLLASWLFYRLCEAPFLHPPTKMEGNPEPARPPALALDSGRS